MLYFFLFALGFAGGTVGFLIGAAIEHAACQLWRLHRQRHRKPRMFRCPVCNQLRYMGRDN